MGDPFQDRPYWDGWLETATREELKALQERKLQAQVEWVFHRSPYWHERLREAGLSPRDIRTVEDLAQVPFLDKKAFLEETASPPYGHFLCYPLEEIERQGAIVYRTTGTTGRQGQFINTYEGWQLYGDEGIRLLWSGGMRPGDYILNTFPYSMWAAGWGFQFAARKAGFILLAGVPPLDTSMRAGSWWTAGPRGSSSAHPKP